MKFVVRRTRLQDFLIEKTIRFVLADVGHVFHVSDRFIVEHCHVSDGAAIITSDVFGNLFVSFCREECLI